MSERSYRFGDGTEYRQTLLMERMMKALGITEDDLDDKRRGRKPNALKLQLLAGALYATGISKRRISRLMDRDRSTVLYALRAVAEREAEVARIVRECGVGGATR